MYFRILAIVGYEIVRLPIKEDKMETKRKIIYIFTSIEHVPLVIFTYCAVVIVF